jgi:hypothetical protein
MEEILKQEFIDTCIEYGELPLSRATELWDENRYDFMDNVNIEKDRLTLQILEKEKTNEK